MKFKKVLLILFLIGSVSVIVSSGLDADNPNTLCHQNEQIIMNGRLKKNPAKILSLCASKNLSESKGYLQYRFGNKNHIELSYPKNKAHPDSYFRYSRYTRPRTTYLRLSFKKNNIQYALYDDSTDEASSSGLMITFPNKKRIDLELKKPVTGKGLMFLESVLEREDFKN